MNEESNKTREALHEYQHALQMQSRAQSDLYWANNEVARTLSAYEQAFARSNPVTADAMSEQGDK